MTPQKITCCQLLSKPTMFMPIEAEDMVGSGSCGIPGPFRECKIVDADGRVIDRSRFLNVIESGALSHESMESTDVEVRLHGDTAVVTGITTSKGQFMGQGFTTRERATDVLARLDGRWLCVFSQLTRVASP